MTLEDAARAGRRRRPDTARGNRWVSAVITAGPGSAVVREELWDTDNSGFSCQIMSRLSIIIERYTIGHILQQSSEINTIYKLLGILVCRDLIPLVC